MELQYDMFINKDPMTLEEAHLLRQEIKHVMDTSDRVRRGLFARLGEQGKIILKLMQEIEELKDKRKPVIYEFHTQDTLFKRQHG